MKRLALGFLALLLLSVLSVCALAQSPAPFRPEFLALSSGTKTAASTTATLTTNGTTAAGNPTLHFAATTGVIDGMGIVDSTAPTVIPAGTVVLSHTATTAVMSANAVNAGVGGTDSIVFSGATLNKSAGVITTEALTTAAAASYTLTVADSSIAATDQVFASVAYGTSTTGTPAVTRVTPGAGTLAIVIQNVHASVALNGTLKISFGVLKN